jgi:subtilisin family serine protease
MLTLAAAVPLAWSCSEEVTSPRESQDTTGFSAQQVALDLTTPTTPERYLVGYKGKAATKLESEVEVLGGSLDAVYERFGIAIVSGIDGDGADALGKVNGVDFVELEPVFEIGLPAEVSEAEAVDASIASTDNPAGAYFYGRQWNMRAIDADVAWAAGRLGSPSVTVAILDTGLDYLHADTDGLVDLSRSASFVELDDQLAAIYFPSRNPITDLHYHGTHVSATVASNALAAAGVTSKVTLIGVRVCSVAGGCPGASIFEGFVHAVDNGADVINMSLGGGFYKKDYPGYVSSINQLFNYAKTNGVTVVVSAGNEEIDLDHEANFFKTYCDAPHVICTSATGPTYRETDYGPWENVDAPAWYTNYGRSAVSVAAPGGNPPGDYVRAACSTSSLVIPICQTGTYIVGVAGTSMASPHVAGLAALMVEDFGRKPGRIKNKIQQSADDLGQPGTDPYYGKGRINVATAVGAD